MSQKTSLSNNRTVPSFFEKEFLIETFGREDPSVHERSKKFFNLWNDWRSNELIINSVTELHRALDNGGLYKFKDYQMSQGNSRIRFRRKEDMAQIILSCGDAVKHNA